ncbi:MAG: AI-2E family transporter [Thermodesulfovibrionales bacterium]|jgi:predicted PurR-regulated permease PerM
MDNTTKITGITSLLIPVAAFVVVVAGMKAAQDLLVPFLLSAFIAVVSSPSLFWLRKKGLSTGLALTVVVSGVTAIVLLITALIGSSIQDLAADLPLYQAQIDSKTAGFIELLKRSGVAVPEKGLSEYIDPGAAMSFASGLLSGLGSALSNAFIILLTVIFILLEASSFRSKIMSAFDRPGFSMEKFDRILASVNRYMAIKTWISLGSGVFISIALAILGVHYSLLWGLLAFLLNYIPNIGSIIAAVPAVLLAFLQFGFERAFLAALAYLAVNILLDNVIEPRFMGKGLGLSPLVVFISLAFWGWVLGPVGMILSVPLTMTVKIALSTDKESNWLSILMG